MAIAIAHLLKWKYQPERRSASWESTVVVQRIDTQRLLRTSPSLMRHARNAFDQIYRDGRRIALAETSLAKTAIPEPPVFSLEQVLDEDYLP